jgi:sarcosine oxidase, subunit alpha
MSGRRLPAPFGARIDRGHPVSFTFNGRAYQGYRGDTLASALLANHVELVGRSFKLHRPRGIYTSGIEEPSALMDIGPAENHAPNVRATVLEIFDGLEARSVNAWPSIDLDARAVNGWFSPLLSAGFYYKTFKWPAWHLFEPSIRRAAGLGKAPRHADVGNYEEIAADAEVLVVGGGIAGLSAAIAAAESGAAVTLLSSAPVLGGAASYRSHELVAALLSRVSALPIQLLSRTTAFGIYDHHLVCACELLPSAFTATARPGLRARLWKIRARRIVLAAGAIERPMIFPDNDRPGIMLAGAAVRYVHDYGVACGARTVIAANTDQAYRVAVSLRQAGVGIAAIIDCRRDHQIRADRSRLDGVLIETQASIAAVHGRRAVHGCTVIARGRKLQFDCDLILSAGGFAPTVHLHSQAGGKLRWAEDAAMFLPDGSPSASMASAGACAGIFDQAAAIEHARQVGSTLAGGLTPPLHEPASCGTSLASTHVRRRGQKQFVDLQNDVTAGDVALAGRENYRSVEHLKRYTTLGMGTDQGKTSNVNGLVLMGVETGRDPVAVGTTRFRPPYAPINLGLIAGRRIGALFKPIKRLPAESWHQERGARMEEYGGWMRAAAYPQGGESIEEAAKREARGVRHAVGVFDGTPLGKIEVFGPDAAAFLDLMYVGTISTLSVGQARYGLLLAENGVIVDDGIVARLAGDHFWINTTSSGAERTAAAFEEWLQCEFVTLKVGVVPVTSSWSNITIAGPRAWEWLESAGMPPELAPSRLGHLRMKAVTVDGMPIRALRASFSGELGYELNVPADNACACLERLWSTAPQFGAVAYGVEAAQIMRIEKGFINVGTDTDGTTLPGDIGHGSGIQRKSANFVGRRSLSLPFALDPNRHQLVGLEAADASTLLPVGAHIASNPAPCHSQGYVTSSTLGVALNRPVALAMLARGRTRTGERVRVYHMDRAFEAVVVSPTFLDPKGDRLNGRL